MRQLARRLQPITDVGPRRRTWKRVFTALMAQAGADEDLNWAVFTSLASFSGLPDEHLHPQT
jgi:hypothetical protein